ncbi:MAG TPA: glycosyltransferase [Chloroflexi bacterium]|nr:glycosyltransferase [Chloroflexota bacterium]
MGASKTVASRRHALLTGAAPEVRWEAQQAAQGASTFSVVLPLYNEEENIETLYRRLTAVMEGLGEPYEIIFVDDGSVDSSAEQVRVLHEGDTRVKLVRLARNFGHQAAISAGLDVACGQAVIIIDADLQDPPEVLPEFVATWREGYEVVYAIRQKRKEDALKRAAYYTFYRLLKRLAAIDIPLDSGDFCVMDRRVVDVLTAMPERNRFVRGIRAWVGFRQIGIPCERDCRQAGTPKYNLRKLMRLATDGLVSFSYIPLRLASLFGFVISAVAFALALWTIYEKLIHPDYIAGLTTIVVAVSLLGGIQLITLGIIGEYIGRIFDEVKQRPLYTVREVLGFDEQ